MIGVEREDCVNGTPDSLLTQHIDSRWVVMEDEST